MECEISSLFSRKKCCRCAKFLGKNKDLNRRHSDRDKKQFHRFDMLYMLLFTTAEFIILHSLEISTYTGFQFPNELYGINFQRIDICRPVKLQSSCFLKKLFSKAFNLSFFINFHILARHVLLLTMHIVPHYLHWFL